VRRISFLAIVCSLICQHAVISRDLPRRRKQNGTSLDFFSYHNLLPNDEMELDEDVNNIPDGWYLYSWFPERGDFIREAVVRYLDLSVPEIGVSMEGRRAFLGERSVKFFTPTGKIGPGIWTDIPLSPGIYTLNLVARSTGSENRVVATFLAQDGKLTQVDNKWRWVHHSEKINYSTPASVISFNDWTFLPGGVYVDHVSLIKLPFDVAYEKNLQLVKGENTYSIRIENLLYKFLPLGINLELQQPSGTIIRKNMELDVSEDNSEFVFTLKAEEAGEYSARIELYNPRTTTVLFCEEGVRGHLDIEPDVSLDSLNLPTKADDLFPVGISIKGYEIDALEEKGMNAILLKDTDLEHIGDVIKRAEEIGLKIILELDASDSMHLSEMERNLIEKVRNSPTLLGYSLLSGWGGGTNRSQSLNSVSGELRELDPAHQLILRNYLPGPMDADVLGSADALFVDPFPVTIPSKPLYTMSEWVDNARRATGSGMRFIAMIQAFAGWPYAKREPTLAEMRALTRLALNHGVDGVFFHTFSADLPFFDDPISSNWDIRRSQDIWAHLDDLVTEIKEFHEKFGKPVPADLRVRFIPESTLDIAYFRTDDDLFVQIVNVMPVEVGIRAVSQYFNEGGEVPLDSEPGALSCGEGFFEDVLPPLGVRIYRIGDLLPPDNSE